MTSNLTRDLLLALMVLFPCITRASQQAAPPVPTVMLTDIQLTYKRDPRMVDPTRGIGPLAPGPNYSSAYAQDTVEVWAEGVEASGKPTKISPQWSPSDPEMVTVSPSQGDDVKITVHRAGDSKLKITYQELSMELMIKAKYVNKFLSFEIIKPTVERAKPVIAPELPPAPKTKNDVSYAIGMNLAKALEEQSVEADADLLIQGFKDAYSGSKTLMNEQEALAALEGLELDQRIVEAGWNRKALAEKNKREGEAFLAANKSKEGVVTLPSGLQYKIINAGKGKKPTANDEVTVQYRATFVDGKQFDSSFDRHAPTNLPVKALIKGWQEGLQLMPIGSKWQLFVPAGLAYGERGAGGGGGRRIGPAHEIVGPNATLIFEVELLSVQEPSSVRTTTSGTADLKSALTPEMMEALKKTIQTEPKPETKENIQ